MNSSNHPISIEELLRHSDWVSGLARRLVGDDADDVVQDTWLQALRHPPRHAGSVRHWLGEVLRNQVRSRVRSEVRRRKREQVAAVSATEASTSDVVAKAKLQRDVVDRVLELEEPYRSAVLLRFFENLPPRELAERLSVPVNTARTHVRRGLERLRGNLDDDYGDRTKWQAALVPLAFPSRRSSGVLSPVVVAASLIVICGLAWWVTRDDPEDSPGATSDEMALKPIETRPDAENPRQPHRTSDRRVALDDRPSGVREDEDTSTPREDPLVMATLWNDRGDVLVGHNLWYVSNDQRERVVTDGEGEFFLPRSVVGEVARLGLISRSLSLLGGVSVLLEIDGEAQDVIGFIAVPTHSLEGRLFGEGSAPLASGRLRIMASVESLLDFPHRITGVTHYVQPPSVSSESDGRFRLDGVPSLRNVAVRATHSRHESIDVLVPGEDQVGFDIVLEPKEPATTVSLIGKVVNGRGEPVVASLSYGRAQTKSDPSGVFSLSHVPYREGASLFISSPGWQALSIPRVGEHALRDPVAWSDAHLVLESESHSIRGCVHQTNDLPLKLELLDPTLSDISFTSLEQRSGGRRGPVTLGPDGRFDLGGLANRPYRLRIWSDVSLQTQVTQPIEAGAEGVEIEFTPHQTRVEGCVVDELGLGFADASVTVGFSTFINRSGGSLSEAAPPVLTDESGRFTVAVPELGFLSVSATGFVPHSIAASDIDDPSDLTVTLRRKRQFRVVAPPGIVGFEVLSAEGEPLMVSMLLPLESETTRLVSRRAYGFPLCEVVGDVTHIRVFDSIGTETSHPIELPAHERHQLILY